MYLYQTGHYYYYYYCHYYYFYIKVPPETVSDSTKLTLSLLQETRPKITIVYWLKGQQQQLGLSATDYVEVGNNNNRDSLASSYVRIWSPSAKDAHWAKSLVFVVVTVIVVVIIYYYYYYYYY